jgi:polyhydroxybutyrate depolymerase
VETKKGEMRMTGNSKFNSTQPPVCRVLGTTQVTFSFFTAILLLFTFLSVSSTSQTKSERINISFEGRERYYLIAASTASTTEPTPLVLVLHGGGGNPAQVEKHTGFSSLAAEKGFIVAYPAGISNNWNDGRTFALSQASKDNVNDVGFLLAVIDDITSKRQIDQTRIFCTGISNGAMMSLRMACEASDRIAAVAAVAGNLPEELINHQPKDHVSIMLMNGDEDPLVPWEGGYVHFGRQKRGKVISAMDTFKYWQDRNGMESGSLTTTWMADNDPGDGCHVQVFNNKNPKDNTEVILLDIQGGGHTWPGEKSNLPTAIVGRVCRDFNGTKTIWEFFSRHDSTRG